MLKFNSYSFLGELDSSKSAMSREEPDEKPYTFDSFISNLYFKYEQRGCYFNLTLLINFVLVKDKIDAKILESSVS